MRQIHHASKHNLENNGLSNHYPSPYQQVSAKDSAGTTFPVTIAHPAMPDATQQRVVANDQPKGKSTGEEQTSPSYLHAKTTLGTARKVVVDHFSKFGLVTRSVGAVVDRVTGTVMSLYCCVSKGTSSNTHRMDMRNDALKRVDTPGAYRRLEARSPKASPTIADHHASFYRGHITGKSKGQIPERVEPGSGDRSIYPQVRWTQSLPFPQWNVAPQRGSP